MSDINEEISRLARLIHDADPKTACDWQRLIARVVGKDQRNYVLVHTPYLSEDALFDATRKKLDKVDLSARVTVPCSGPVMPELLWNAVLDRFALNLTLWCDTRRFDQGERRVRSLCDVYEISLGQQVFEVSTCGSAPARPLFPSLAAFSRIRTSLQGAALAPAVGLIEYYFGSYLIGTPSGSGSIFIKIGVPCEP